MRQRYPRAIFSHDVNVVLPVLLQVLHMIVEVFSQPASCLIEIWSVVGVGRVFRCLCDQILAHWHQRCGLRVLWPVCFQKL